VPVEEELAAARAQKAKVVAQGRSAAPRQCR
jgi:hypothetical protein